MRLVAVLIVMSFMSDATAAPAPVAARFATLLSARPEQYAAARAEFLRDTSATSFLEERAKQGQTPHERAIARALLRRLHASDVAKRLDAWAPSARATHMHNMTPYVDHELGAAYLGEPDLAYERLVIAAAPRSTEALLAVVAAGPSDGFALLSGLIDRYPRAADQLAGLDAGAAVAPILAALAGSDVDTRQFLIITLGATKTQRPDALAALRGLLSAPEPGVRAAAAATLGRVGDAGAVDLLVPLLGSSDTSLATFTALGQILGDVGRDRRLAAFAIDSDPTHRHLAALALQFGDEATGPLRVELLGALAADHDDATRVRALESLAIVALPEDGRRYSATVETNVLAALRSTDTPTRRAATGALWRIVTGRHRPVGIAIQRAAVRGLGDADEDVHTAFVIDLDTYFGARAAAIIVMLDELGRVDHEWPTAETAARAHADVKDLPAEVAALAKLAVPELRVLVQEWRRHK